MCTMDRLIKHVSNKLIRIVCYMGQQLHPEIWDLDFTLNIASKTLPGVANMHQWVTKACMPSFHLDEVKPCRSCHVHGASQAALLLLSHTIKAKLTSDQVAQIQRPDLHSRGSLSRCSLRPSASRASAPKSFPFLSCCAQKVICPFHLLCLQVVMLCDFLQPATQQVSPPWQALSFWYTI